MLDGLRQARRGATVSGVLLALAVSGAAPARAVIGTADVVPAATLLLPHFEVDVSTSPSTRETVLTIVNAAPSPALARLVLWTDYGVPTHGVTLFFTGFDVELVGLRSVFDTAGPAVAAAHRGQASALFGGLCAGFNHGDDIARGYVTIDNVNDETDLFPGDPGYFDFDASGIASNVNQLWGQYFAGDSERGIAEGGPLVHVEADDSLTQVSFYSRETDFNSNDNRERLPTRWGVRYWNGLTDLICWRDDVRLQPFACPNQSTAPISAQGLSAAAPLALIVFDHAAAGETPPQPVEPCRLAAGRVRVGGPLFPVSPKTGWIHADADPEIENGAFPRGLIIPRTQAFIGAVHALHPDQLTVGIGGVGLDGLPILGAPAATRGGRR